RRRCGGESPLFLFRTILFLMFVLIAAKLFGAVLKAVREIFSQEQPHSGTARSSGTTGTYVHTTPQPPIQKYDNVQDADFEEVDDQT
ncbi:MAG: hypothetical protein KGJ59_06010, partial [Bacteroidota bacterium]|nr:hypothetical protein [Bacteroidota bacterium]